MSEAIEFASLAGELLLKNGAETARVEDTVTRICVRAGFCYTEVIVFPTAIIINGECEGYRHTRAVRIKFRDINMEVVSEVNNLSRKFSEGKITLQEGLAECQEISKKNLFNNYFLATLLAGAFASGSATILFGGSPGDFAPAFLATAMVRLVIGATASNLGYVLQIYFAGLFAGFLGNLFVDLGFGIHLDKIIIGALIPFFPGVQLTNAVQDFIYGDLLSGTLRMVEALLVSAALAGGVGLSIALYSSYFKQIIF